MRIQGVGGALCPLGWRDWQESVKSNKLIDNNNNKEKRREEKKREEKRRKEKRRKEKRRKEKRKTINREFEREPEEICMDSLHVHSLIHVCDCYSNCPNIINPHTSKSQKVRARSREPSFASSVTYWRP